MANLPTSGETGAAPARKGYSGALIGGAVGGAIGVLLSRLFGVKEGWLMGLFGLGGAAAGVAAGDHLSGERSVIDPVRDYLGFSTDRPPIPSPHRTEEDFLAGLYLNAHPDVAEELLSGKAERAGHYRSAREHYEKFGKAAGHAWTLEEYEARRGEFEARGIRVPRRAGGQQPCDLTGIPVSASGEVTAGAAAMQRELMRNNRVIFYGDPDHGDPAIPVYLRENLRANAAEGLTDMCLEINRARQKDIDAYYKTGDTTHLDDFNALFPVSPEYRRLIIACKEENDALLKQGKYGLRVHCMDKLSADQRPIRAYSAEYYYTEQHKQRKGDPAELAKLERWHTQFIQRFGGEAAYRSATALFDYQRYDVNTDWADYLADRVNPAGKAIVVGGTHHQENVAGMEDADEILSARLGGAKVVYCRLETSKNPALAQPQARSGTQLAEPAAGQAAPYTELPEFIVTLPQHHMALTQACRKSLPKAEFADINARCKRLMDEAFKQRLQLQPYRDDTVLGPLLKPQLEAYFLLADGELEKAQAAYRELAGLARERHHNSPVRAALQASITRITDDIGGLLPPAPPPRVQMEMLPGAAREREILEAAIKPEAGTSAPAGTPPLKIAASPAL